MGFMFHKRSIHILVRKVHYIRGKRKAILLGQFLKNEWQKQPVASHSYYKNATLKQAVSSPSISAGHRFKVQQETILQHFLGKLGKARASTLLPGTADAGSQLKSLFCKNQLLFRWQHFIPMLRRYR